MPDRVLRLTAAVPTPPLSDATRRAYARDWFAFAAWCRAQPAEPAALPADPVLVAAYLASLAGTLGRSALGGRLAAIAHEHRRRGLDWTAAHPEIRAALRSTARRPDRPATGLTPAEIGRMAGACPDDLAGLRDRALLLVGLAGSLQRSALVAVDFAHLRFEADAAIIHIAAPARGRPGMLSLARLRGPHGTSPTCPVQALERWLARARIRRGPVFRSVTAGGRLGDRLSGDGVRRILLRRAELAGLALKPGQRVAGTGGGLPP